MHGLSPASRDSVIGTRQALAAVSGGVSRQLLALFFAIAGVLWQRI